MVFFQTKEGRAGFAHVETVSVLVGQGPYYSNDNTINIGSIIIINILYPIAGP